ncbi:MAG: hypothetical protein RLN62_01695 [Rickettsiales bacterium]
MSLKQDKRDFDPELKFLFVDQETNKFNFVGMNAYKAGVNLKQAIQTTNPAHVYAKLIGVKDEDLNLFNTMEEAMCVETVLETQNTSLYYEDSMGETVSSFPRIVDDYDYETNNPHKSLFGNSGIAKCLPGTFCTEDVVTFGFSICAGVTEPTVFEMS